MKKLMILVFLVGCTSSQRNWRTNTSIDMGVQIDKDLDNSSKYVGASYFLDYGFSTNIGVWQTFSGYTGPYAGMNYSVTPFD